MNPNRSIIHRLAAGIDIRDENGIPLIEDPDVMRRVNEVRDKKSRKASLVTRGYGKRGQVSQRNRRIT